MLFFQQSKIFEIEAQRESHIISQLPSTTPGETREQLQVARWVRRTPSYTSQLNSDPVVAKLSPSRLA